MNIQKLIKLLKNAKLNHKEFVQKLNRDSSLIKKLGKNEYSNDLEVECDDDKQIIINNISSALETTTSQLLSGALSNLKKKIESLSFNKNKRKKSNLKNISNKKNTGASRDASSLDEDEDFHSDNSIDNNNTSSSTKLLSADEEKKIQASFFQILKGTSTNDVYDFIPDLRNHVFEIDAEDSAEQFFMSLTDADRDTISNTKNLTNNNITRLVSFIKRLFPDDNSLVKVLTQFQKRLAPYFMIYELAIADNTRRINNNNPSVTTTTNVREEALGMHIPAVPNNDYTISTLAFSQDSTSSSQLETYEAIEAREDQNINCTDSSIKSNENENEIEIENVILNSKVLDFIDRFKVKPENLKPQIKNFLNLLFDQENHKENSSQDIVSYWQENHLIRKYFSWENVDNYSNNNVQAIPEAMLVEIIALFWKLNLKIVTTFEDMDKYAYYGKEDIYKLSRMQSIIKSSLFNGVMRYSTLTTRFITLYSQLGCGGENEAIEEILLGSKKAVSTLFEVKNKGAKPKIISYLKSSISEEMKFQRLQKIVNTNRTHVTTKRVLACFIETADISKLKFSLPYWNAKQITELNILLQDKTQIQTLKNNYGVAELSVLNFNQKQTVLSPHFDQIGGDSFSPDATPTPPHDTIPSNLLHSGSSSPEINSEEISTTSAAIPQLPLAYPPPQQTLSPSNNYWEQRAPITTPQPSFFPTGMQSLFPLTDLNLAHVNSSADLIRTEPNLLFFPAPPAPKDNQSSYPPVSQWQVAMPVPQFQTLSSLEQNSPLTLANLPSQQSMGNDAHAETNQESISLFNSFWESLISDNATPLLAHFNNSKTEQILQDVNLIRTKVNMYPKEKLAQLKGSIGGKLIELIPIAFRAQGPHESIRKFMNNVINIINAALGIANNNQLLATSSRFFIPANSNNNNNNTLNNSGYPTTPTFVSTQSPSEEN